MQDIEEIADRLIDSIDSLLNVKCNIELDMDELDEIRDTIDRVLTERLEDE